MKRELLAALALACTTAAAAPALAAPPPIVVKVSDLDLNTTEGQAVAQTRIQSTAERACTMVLTGSRIAKPSPACVEDVTQRLVSGLEMKTQQAAKAAPVQSAGASAQPKAIDQQER